MFSPLIVFLICLSLTKVYGLCGTNIRWSHRFNMEEVYGMWYGVGYFQHTPDIASRPNEIGCVTLYITDATAELNDDWLSWTNYRRDHTNQNWRSYRSNPLSGSWDVRVKRKAKRGLYDTKRLRVIWDEDGQSMEQNYYYYVDEPGLWTAEERRPMEMRAKSIDMWYPNNHPLHPDNIRVLKVTPDNLVINHCAETGGIFSLMLRRSPDPVCHWEWHELREHLYSFDLNKVYRHAAVCGACAHTACVVYLAAFSVLLRIL